MKKILIPTDFSSNSQDALAYALSFVEDQETTIHIIHVIMPPFINSVDSGTVNTTVLKILQEEADKRMDALKVFSDLTYGVSNVKIETKITAGDTIHSIKSYAKEIDANLIIMGTMGQNHNIIERKVGTISTSMTENAPCPILLIPHNYKYKKIDNVVFSTDLDHGDPYILYKALKLIEPHNPSVRCIYVSKEKNDMTDKKIEEYGNYIVNNSDSIQTFFEIVIADNIADTVYKQSIKYGAELVIMHKSKKPLLKRIFSSKNVKGMVNITDNPLLVMN